MICIHNFLLYLLNLRKKCQVAGFDTISNLLDNATTLVEYVYLHYKIYDTSNAWGVQVRGGGVGVGRDVQLAPRVFWGRVLFRQLLVVLIHGMYRVNSKYI